MPQKHSREAVAGWAPPRGAESDAWSIQACISPQQQHLADISEGDEANDQIVRPLPLLN